MKREDLKAKGIADEHIDYVLDAFHREQEALRVQSQTLTDERDEAREEVKKYQQGGELYQDPGEIEALRKFKSDTEAEKVKATKDKAFDGLMAKLNVRAELKPLVSKMLDYDKITLTEKGEVSEAYEKAFAEELKAACPTAFDVPPSGTGILYGNSLPATNAQGDGKPVNPTNAEWAEAISARTNLK